MMPIDTNSKSITEVWDLLCKQEKDREKRYALTLTIVMFALLPAFLELLNTFAGNVKWNWNGNKDGDGKLMKQVMLLCTIASYTFLGATTWHMTQFMREDPNKRALFFWGFYFFCIEAALLSVLVLQYQNHLDDCDNVWLKSTWSIWTVLGLVAIAGSVLNNIILFSSSVEVADNELKENEKDKDKDKERLSWSSNYIPERIIMHCFLSEVLYVLSYGLLLGFMDIAYHAYYKYEKPRMATAAIIGYATLALAALLFKDYVVHELMVFMMPTIILLEAFIITTLLCAPEELDLYNRFLVNKVHCGVAIFFMCYTALHYALGDE